MLRTALYRLTHKLRSLRLTETLKSIGLEIVCRFVAPLRGINKAVLVVVLAVVLTPVTSAIYSYTRVSTPVYAAAPSTLNFQARLMGQNGAIVADGNYSVQFKLYDAVTGGSNVWTETQTVTIKGGYLSVSLGAVTPFGSVDFANQHWLTMNVAGDGEMNPRIRLTAVPFAFAASKATGLTSGSSVITADGFAQVAPAGLQSLNSTNSALRLNQTGAGGLLQLQGNGSDVLTVSKTGALVASGSLTGNGGLTITGGASISGGLTLNSSAISGVTTLGLSGSITGATTNTINGLSINAGALSSVTGITFTSGNLDLAGGNIQNAGTISGASGSFSVDANGNITSAFTALNGSSTANGGSGLGSSASLTLNSAANFEVGNYVRVANANCGGTGINVCYAKITAKATNTLTISPALTWANGAAVTEYRVPEVGGTNGSQPLENRFGRGYFISGVATGNGTTFYTEDGIATTLTSFNIANENVTTLNIGGAASSISLGAAATTVSVSGNLQTAATKTITAGGGLVVSSGGLNLNSTNITNAGTIGGVTGLTFTSGSLNLATGGITNTGALSGVTTISASGAITAATTNTINGLNINAGTVSGVTGITFTSGSLNINNGGITNAGSITGVGTNITGSGALTLASGASGNLSLNAASGLALLGATTLQTTAGLTIDLNNGSNVLLALQNSGAGVASLNLVDGELQIGGTSVLTNTRVLQNVTANTSILTAGTLGVSRGGTGLATLTTNGLLLANGATSLTQVTPSASGQLLLSNGSSVPTFTTISGDGTISSAGVLNVAANAVALGTDTTGNYVSTVTTGNGLSVSGVGAENATAALSLVLDSASGLSTSASGLSLIKTCTNGQLLKWNGTAWACAADNTGFSDSGLKQNVVNVGSVLNAMKNVRVVNYQYKCADAGLLSMRFDCDTHTGIIAQEIETLFPGSTKLNAQGYREVNFQTLNFYTMRGLVELANIVSANGDAALNNVSTGGTVRLSSTGALQNITGLNIISGGATIAGGLSATGTISLNANALTATTSIGTGTTTGAVSIGGGLNSLTINSTAFDVTAAGAVSGITTLSATGNINTTGVYQQAGLSGVTLAACGATQYLGGIRVSGGLITAVDTCRSAGLSDATLKTNVAAVSGSSLDALKNIQIVNFDFDCTNNYFNSTNTYCDPKRQTGVLAQQLATVIPDLVYEDEQGIKHVNYEGLSMYALKGVSEISRYINSAGNVQNLTGLTVVSGGTSITGGLNNNGGGITNVGSLSGVSSLFGQSITLNATNSGNILQINKDSQGVFTIANSGALEMRLSNQRAFSVQDAEGRGIFGIDSMSGNVRIGSGNEGKLVLFTLDNKVTAGDPANATNGSQYYNSATNKFRCYQNNAWRDCLPNTHSEYAIVMQPQQWQQAGVLSEVPGSQRSWVDLSEANQFRVIANINATGAAQAACRVQSSTDNGLNWQDLGEPNQGTISLSQSGTIKSDWVSLASGAKAESLLRVACEGGNNNTAPAIGSVKLQAR